MKLRVECITWFDSMGRSGWVPTDELQDPPTKMITVGLVIKETRKSVTVTHSVGHGQAYAPFTIPKRAIAKRRML